MAMEINESYRYYRNDYYSTSEQLKMKQQENDIHEAPVPKDEYISSEAMDSKPSGLYRLGQDENGNPKVMFDDPKKPARSAQDGNPEASGENCTTNTGQVDREIEQLKEEKKHLQQQIKTASGDEKKVRELEKKLAQIESELIQKDNDTYRRQNAVVTSE